ncbi:DNA-directed RNA polymerase I subunit Rpa12p [Trichomonascus vanleenenianus]|uniref:DNA-directed RNA polymerase I core subunit RPA12 n=1 Tax=Trichomonascus vanleenenianus TaxID=2268995 RepID=UPI003ECAC326
MSAVGSLIFCTSCGNLLESVTDKKSTLDCFHCGQSYPSKDFANLQVVTKSSANAFPSTLRLKRSEVKTILDSDEVEEGATIKEKCPKCGNDEMQYHTLQLRSADEGATVFYTCTKCNYRFRQNN